MRNKFFPLATILIALLVVLFSGCAAAPSGNLYVPPVPEIKQPYGLNDGSVAKPAERVLTFLRAEITATEIFERTYEASGEAGVFYGTDGEGGRAAYIASVDVAVRADSVAGNEVGGDGTSDIDASFDALSELFVSRFYSDTAAFTSAAADKYVLNEPKLFDNPHIQGGEGGLSVTEGGDFFIYVRCKNFLVSADGRVLGAFGDAAQGVRVTVPRAVQNFSVEIHGIVAAPLSSVLSGGMVYTAEFFFSLI